ncbi:uncharacterized protein LOC142333339 [Lycorma delicatula]|uniref:uncharacterized protein LOC142333339 n=1 Tax=Lycorma delicatula TaxID=130591 RepID=UPI003F513EDE
MFKQKRDRCHLIKKIANREITGSFIPNHSFHTRQAKVHELFKNIPSRCTYQLSELILLGRQVFMGTTRCGRFLVTYSYLTSPSLLSPSHEYRLHWWLHHPFKQATKVAEVKLFSDQAINNIITIGIAQWPNVNNRLIIYGYSAGNDEDNMASSSSSISSELDQRRYYFTITTLPSTNDCKDCKNVALSFNEEDMAANWDSCVGLSCLKHGLTVHTSFDVLFPFPSFHSCINLKCDNKIIFNSGNFLHVIFVEMENNNLRLKCNQPKDSIIADRVNHKIGKSLFINYPKEYLLPINVTQAYQIHQTILLYQQDQQPQQQPAPQQQQQQTTERARRWCNRIPNLAMKPVPTKTKAWRRTITDQAEKVYAFEEVEDGCEPKFKWYRRRRLADKMYEFCSDEEDMENIQPEGKNKLPRYKFSSPSPEKKTVCDKTDLLINDDKQIIPSSKLEVIQQPFTKMIINNKIRVTERYNKDRKTDPELLNNNPQDVNDNNKISLPHTSDSCFNSPDSLNINNCIYNFNTPPLSPLSKKNSFPDTSGNCTPPYVNNNMDNNSIFTVKDINNKCNIGNDLITSQLVIKTDERQDCCSSDISAKHETVLDIIKEWEVDSVSSLSPKCETWIPNPSDIKRHNLIQKFLEIPQQNNDSIRNIFCHNSYRNSGTGNKKQAFESLLSVGSKERKSFQTMIKSSLSNNEITRFTTDNTTSKQNFVSRNEIPINDNENENISLSSNNSTVPKIKIVLRPCNTNKFNLKISYKQTNASSSNSDRTVFRTASVQVKEEKRPLNFNKSIKEQLHEAFGHQLIQGCSVQLDRRFIEVDEEMISTITDIEDDDQSSIGFHCALPIVVHGTAYSQLQMISNSKADKLNVPSVFVRQNSLDIEPLCHQAADIICKCEHYKFWSLNDYETEIINICPFNGDILFLVHMRLNVESLIYHLKKQSSDKREYYECQCIFIWNCDGNECRLEAYTKLTSANSLNSFYRYSASSTFAQREASKLRNNPNIGLFSYNLNLPVRSLDHELYDDEYNLIDTVHEIRDQTNFIVITLDNTDTPDNSRHNVIELM